MKKKIILEEADYSPNMIKKITPYLNHIHITYTQKGTSTIKRKYLSLKHRSYAWYYVYNNGNAADAHKRAYYSDYHYGRRKLIPRKNINYQTSYTEGARLHKMPAIMEAIRLIRENLITKIKTDAPQTLLDQLQKQTFYDPCMFVKPDGSPAFDNWDDIPREYRCCIKSIKQEATKYGFKTVLELVDRAEARKELLKVAPDLLAPEKIEVVHKTIDERKEEIGINFNKLSDSELLDMINGVQCR